MPFDNSYTRLPESFFQRIDPVPVAAPRLIKLNRPLADQLELDLPDDNQELADIFSGNTLMEGADPIAQAYAGHQFGGFVPQLGDGRALLLGEVITNDDSRYDIQLKGSGQTRFSRNGDGRSPLGPVIREYVVSEAMHALGIPTTRALAMVTTGETVHRETPLPGAILTRVADGFVRVGTFEFFAARQDFDSVRVLADYVIERHYPDCRDSENPYAALFEAVCIAQARLVAKWLCIGFIHGVMNTDNTAITGETIDYGPCAFMDHFNPSQVFSSIDHMGRYAYNQQPNIAVWNLACLGGCLVPLLHTEPNEAKRVGESILESFTPEFASHYQSGMCRKIGLETSDSNQFELVRELLDLMQKDHADFTMTFRQISKSATDTSGLSPLFPSGGIKQWIVKWRAALDAQGLPADTVCAAMLTENPAFIPRNHRIEEAIRAAEDNDDFTLVHKLVNILTAPYDDQPENKDYAAPPAPEERVHQTFCGT